MQLAGLLRQAAAKPYGPRPAFTEADVVRTLWLLGQSPWGRQRLSSRLGIGEGSMRSLLSIFSKAGFVSVRQTGCSLSPAGQQLYGELSARIRWAQEVEASVLSFNLPAYGICVRQAGQKVRKGIEERDAAVREGASGATVLLARKRRLVFPGTNESVEPMLSERLLDASGAMPSDVIILCYAPAKAWSERGAWAAALRLIT
ncbi:MAG: DUF4443 domain-containing protein [Candidatus Micrarchaeota archaeon]